MTGYTTAADPSDPDIVLLTLGAVTFRVRGADRPGAEVWSAWTSQIDQIAAGLALIPLSHHVSIAPSEIRIVPGSGGSSFHFEADRITIHSARFTSTFNRRTFQSLIHECGHSYDKRRQCTQRVRSHNRVGRDREQRWVEGLSGPILRWISGESPTFPRARPQPDDWDHFRAIDYRGTNRDRRSGLPTEGESFAEGYMKHICRPLNGRLSADQDRIISGLIEA